MKTLLTVIAAILTVSAVELELKDGTIITGEVICEEKGALTLKDGNETVSVYKKSIKRADTIQVAGSRKFMLGEEYLLKEKNEILYINGSRDSLTVRLRNAETGLRTVERTAGPGDTASIAIADGSYFETVRYWRPEGEYHITGTPFTIETKCGKFERYEFELKGYAGDSFPKLKGPKIEYERD